jgi:hypothetical protein
LQSTLARFQCIERGRARAAATSEEIQSIKKITICDVAYKEAQQNRTNVFLRCFCGGRWVPGDCVSSRRLRFARESIVGARSVQALDQMSDKSLQRLLAKLCSGVLVPDFWQNARHLKPSDTVCTTRSPRQQTYQGNGHFLDCM